MTVEKVKELAAGNDLCGAVKLLADMHAEQAGRIDAAEETVAALALGDGEEVAEEEPAAAGEEEQQPA